MKRVYGEDHEEYASTLKNLSRAMFNLGDYEGAKKGYLKSLSILSKINNLKKLNLVL